jgi:hypothetical protein
MLNKLEKFVRVRNTAKERKCLVDRVRGEFWIDAGEAINLPGDVWSRNFRTSWLERFVDAPEAVESEPESKETPEEPSKQEETEGETGEGSGESKETPEEPSKQEETEGETGEGSGESKETPEESEPAVTEEELKGLSIDELKGIAADPGSEVKDKTPKPVIVKAILANKKEGD